MTESETLNSLRLSILEKIAQFQSLKNKTEKFIPGQTSILTGLAVYDSAEISSAVDSLMDGWFGLGRRGEEFEKTLAAYIGRKNAVYTNSGSSANLLALNSLKNKHALQGGEIITPACTFPTTFNPIIQLGFTPRIVDVDKTLNMPIELIDQAITPQTVGIMFAHTLGNSAKVKEVREMVDSRKLCFFIEDCCDALGSKYDGKDCGTFGDAATFSFYPAHAITTGEGGAVLTDDPFLKKSLRSLRDWGRDCWCNTDEKNPLGACGARFNVRVNGFNYDHKYMFSTIGYNLKPLELQAAIGLEQLKKLPNLNAARKRNFERYKKELSGLESFFDLPEINSRADPVFFGLPIILKDGQDRGKFVKFLNENKIATRYLFAGNILRQPAYKNIRYSLHGDLQYTDKLAKDCFWIGLHAGVTEEMIQYVGSKFREYFDSYH